MQEISAPMETGRPPPACRMAASTSHLSSPVVTTPPTFQLLVSATLAPATNAATSIEAQGTPTPNTRLEFACRPSSQARAMM